MKLGKPKQDDRAVYLNAVDKQRRHSASLTVYDTTPKQLMAAIRDYLKKKGGGNG